LKSVEHPLKNAVQKSRCRMSVEMCWMDSSSEMTCHAPATRFSISRGDPRCGLWSPREDAGSGRISAQTRFGLLRLFPSFAGHVKTWNNSFPVGDMGSRDVPERPASPGGVVVVNVFNIKQTAVKDKLDGILQLQGHTCANKESGAGLAKTWSREEIIFGLRWTCPCTRAFVVHERAGRQNSSSHGNWYDVESSGHALVPAVLVIIRVRRRLSTCPPLYICL